MDIQFWTREGTVDLANLLPENLTAEIIGATLAKINRFSGRTIEPWSVAAHSVVVSKLCRPELGSWALLHDAHEVFLGDITCPAVEFLGLCGTRAAVLNAINNAKGRLDRVIGSAWGVVVRSMSLELRQADYIALKAEAYVFMGVAHELTDPADLAAFSEAVDLIDLLRRPDWSFAFGMWLGRVRHFEHLGLLTPPKANDPSSVSLAG